MPRLAIGIFFATLGLFVLTHARFATPNPIARRARLRTGVMFTAAGLVLTCSSIWS
jgi:hypothetical protein